MFETITDKEILNGVTARNSMKKGIDVLADTVSVTLGPQGRTVVIETNSGPHSTKDGVTVAEAIKLEDPVQNLGVEMVRQAASKTAEIAGDGTTTSTVIARDIIASGLKALDAGRDPMQLKKGMQKALEDVVKKIKENAEEVDNFEQIAQVGTISANGDKEIGSFISMAMEAVGKDGVITVEEASGLETYLETVEGLQLDERGYLSPYFITNDPSQTCEMANPLILLYDGKINNMRELIKPMEIALTQSRPLFIIADDVTGEALSTLVVNKIRGMLEVCAVKAPGFGERRIEMLQDIAIVTGGRLISDTKGGRLEEIEIEDFGTCDKVVVSRNNTVVVNGHGNKDMIDARIESLRNQIKEMQSDYDIQKTSERLAKIAGGVAVIYIGAATEVEMKEKKDRLDDALHATKAAVEEGIIPGGGTFLLKISSLLEKNIDPEWTDDTEAGYKMILDSCKSPFYKILTNAGFEPKIVEHYILTENNRKSDYGFDARMGVYVNLLEEGIIDPAKVSRSALENAVSVASTFLTTEAVIYKVKED